MTVHLRGRWRSYNAKREGFMRWRVWFFYCDGEEPEYQACSVRHWTRLSAEREACGLLTAYNDGRGQ